MAAQFIGIHFFDAIANSNAIQAGVDCLEFIPQRIYFFSLLSAIDWLSALATLVGLAGVDEFGVVDGWVVTITVHSILSIQLNTS